MLVEKIRTAAPGASRSAHGVIFRAQAAVKAARRDGRIFFQRFAHLLLAAEEPILMEGSLTPLSYSSKGFPLSVPLWPER